MLFLLRHADPIYDPDDITPLGERQAEALAHRLAMYGIDKIYSSSSTRAIKTAKHTAEMTKRDIEVLDWCHEAHVWNDLAVRRDDGVLTWCFYHPAFMEFFQTKEIKDLGTRWYDHKAFESTNFKDGFLRVQRETDALMESLGYRHSHARGGYIPVAPNQKRVALFAHHGFGMAFLSALLDIPYPMLGTHFEISHTGMTVIEFPENDRLVIPKVLQLSNDSHLYRAGIVTAYNNGIKF